MISEKQLLKLSGKYTLIGIALSLFFWFVIYDMGICYAQTQTGYRIPKRLDIGGGRMTGDMWCQYGANGVRLIIGTQTVTQVGTAGVINGTNATGLPSLDFTYGGGSTSANFNGFNAVYVAGSRVGTSGVFSSKLDATGGVGTNNTFNNPTFAGNGTITATFDANGLAISPAEYASVNNATGELQAQIDTKLTKVGTPTTYLTSVTADGKTGTTSVSLASGSGNFSISSTLNPNGSLAVVLDTTGSSTAKPDIKEGGTVTVTNATHINFDNTHFDTAVDGSGASVTLSETRAGTTSVKAGYVPITIADNLNNWVKPNLSFVSKTDTQSISSNNTWVAISGLSASLNLGSTTSKVRVCLTVTGVASPNSWVRLLRDGTAIAVGDSASNRVTCTLGDFFSGDGNYICTRSTTWIDSPGSTTASYTVEARTSGAATFYVNRSQTDSDTVGFPRGQSSLFIEELYQ